MGILEGIGKHLSTGFSSVRDSERAKLAAPGIRNEAQEFQQLLGVYRAIDPQQTERKTQALEDLRNSPVYQNFQSKVAPLAQKQGDKKATLDEIQALSKTKIAIQDAGFLTEGDELDKSYGKRMKGLSSLLFPVKEKSQRAKVPDIRKSDMPGKEKISAIKEVMGRSEKTGGSPATLFSGEDGIPGSRKAEGEVKELEEFTQVATPASAFSNVRKSRASLGIESPADQQTMQELEKSAPQGLDIQAVAQQDPEAFKQILSALRKGKTPSGKAFTIKDALEMMGQL